jgi:uncharacterized DUF497 family protein
MEFEWDPDRAAQNLRRHRVSFHEAATVFGDPFSMTFPDPDHSIEERRYITIGLSYRRRLLIVAHTDRAIPYASSAHERLRVKNGGFYEEEG